MGFAEYLGNECNKTLTENGANALLSTKSGLLDLFGTVGTLRNADEETIESSFLRALGEDRLLATKLMFHTRNIRGGMGERRVFRIMLHKLANTYPEIVLKNLENVPLFGRWDDLFALINTPCEKEMFRFLQAQLISDINAFNNGEEISLLAKWLKTQKASSKESKFIWSKTVKEFGMTKQEYQHITSKLRRYMNVTEQKMCAKEWGEIKYSAVPSYCMLKHKKAFYRNDEERFNQFIAEVSKGEQKINASTLYPFDIFRNMELSTGWESLSLNNYSRVEEEQWKALPDYLGGKSCNAIVMADTSGSMSGDPLNVAISLAVYFAERNKGQYKNKFMTFSSEPRFVELKGETLEEKVSCIPSIVDNTDVAAAFRVILDTAVKYNVPQDEMPKSLIIISDMQFDSCQSVFGCQLDATLYEQMKDMYNRYNYEIPNVVFWNVRDSKKAFQVTQDTRGVQLVSGMSAAIFKQLMDNIGVTPYECMLSVLNDEMYNCVEI